MNARPAPPRLVSAQVAGGRSGRVVAVELGVVAVACRTGTIRATLGADLLASIAADPHASPRVGDRVELRTWADGPVTVERVLRRARPERLPPEVHGLP